jgi:tetratricopeptide (TPR) repeat protein
MTALLAALLAASASAPALPKPEPWLEVKTANFTLYGNASESKVREVGLELERLRATLAVLLPAHSPTAAVPTQVFVFRSEGSFEPYAPVVAGKPVTARGYFAASDERNVIAVTASWNTDFRSVVYHEYLHFYLNANFSRLPLWFDEGCAEYYSTLRASEGEARVGIVPERHLKTLRVDGLMPLDRLLAITHESPEYRDGGTPARVFYAESWALVHYLARGAPQREGQLERYLAARHAGHPLPEAFQEAFKTDPDRMTAELRRYIEGGRFNNVLVKSQNLKVPAEAASASMTHADVLARLGGLLARGGETRRAEAEAYLAASLSEEPGTPVALSELGALRLGQGRVDEARELLAKASARGDALAAYRYAKSLLQGVWFDRKQPVSAPERAAALESAQAALRTCVARDPRFGEAYVLLGMTLSSSGNLDGAIEAFDAAIKLLPGRRELLADLALVYDRKGDADKAAGLLRAAGPDGAEVAKRLNQRKVASEPKAEPSSKP